MNFFRYTLIAILALALIGGASYLYASSGIKSKPGYVVLPEPDNDSAKLIVGLKLGPGGVWPVQWLLKTISNSSEADLDVSEKVLLGVMQEIQGVQLRIYEVDGNRGVFEAAIKESVATLRGENWNTLLRVREDDEYVVVMQSGDDTLIEGLSILVSTPENAVFLNLMGPFHPDSLAMIANNI